MEHFPHGGMSFLPVAHTMRVIRVVVFTVRWMLASPFVIYPTGSQNGMLALTSHAADSAHFTCHSRSPLFHCRMGHEHWKKSIIARVVYVTSAGCGSG